MHGRFIMHLLSDVINNLTMKDIFTLVHDLRSFNSQEVDDMETEVLSSYHEIFSVLCTFMGQKTALITNTLMDRLRDPMRHCAMCEGLYVGSDIYNHSCSKCWNCSRPFEGYGDKPVRRYNALDRFKAFHNTCVKCKKPKSGNLFQEFGL